VARGSGDFESLIFRVGTAALGCPVEQSSTKRKSTPAVPLFAHVIPTAADSQSESPSGMESLPGFAEIPSEADVAHTN